MRGMMLVEVGQMDKKWRSVTSLLDLTVEVVEPAAIIYIGRFT